MAKSQTTKGKIVRKFGENIFGNPKYDRLLNRKPYAPGQHGQGRRSKLSNYGTQLREKQKIKFMYGLLENQFRLNFVKADKMKGETGTNMLQLLESRLDNVAFRLGFAPSRPAARQLVSHKHFLVNNKVVNIPSYIVKEGDVIEVRDKSKKMDIIFCASGWDEESIDFLDEMGIPFFKMASADLTNFPLLIHTAKKNKPMILSTGMADMKMIQAAY